ncbi:glycosyltransferase [Rhodococcus opacus]|uniref:glycosyltransferase n=1 Tax=Rhodococcus opacus TaxID=37919 RepID=UPI003AF8D724
MIANSRNEKDERSSDIDCSVIVLAWQDHQMTRQCVASLGTGFEIVVVDNGSDEPYSRELQAVCAEYRAKYVRSDENLGFSGGMNLGLLASTRSVVVFSNNDVTADPDTVAKLASLALRSGIGAVFPEILDRNGEVATAGGRFLTLSRSISHAVGLSAVKASRTSVTCNLDEAEWYAGPFVVMRRLLALSIGGVPSQSFMYAEDYRLCWQLKKLGLELVVPEGLQIVHVDDATSSKVWSTDRIAEMQTTELLRASVDFQRGLVRKRLLTVSYVFGTWIRHKARRSSRTEAVLTGAMKVLRPASAQSKRT